jgi:hypothetical protein
VKGHLERWLSLGAATLIVTAVTLFSDDSDQEACVLHDEGDGCAMADGSRGVCQVDDFGAEGLECDPIELSDAGRTNLPH